MSAVLPITVVIDPSLVTPERLSELLLMTADYGAVLKTMGSLIEEELAEGFDTQGWGTWAPLSAVTIAEKQRLGYGDKPPLVREGDLRAALIEHDAPGHKFLVSAGSVCVGVYGDVIPYAYWLENGTARMPARIMTQLRGQAVDGLIEAVTTWLGGGPGIQVYADAALTVH